MGQRQLVAAGVAGVAAVAVLSAGQAGFAAQGARVALDLPAQAHRLAAVSTGGSISGAVLGAGKPVVGYTVELFKSDGNFVSDTVTDALGRFSLRSVPAGEYVVRVSGPLRGPAPWAMGWVGDAPTMSQATVLTVSNASSLVADVKLRPTSTVTGRVSGVPAGSEVRVCGETFLDCRIAVTDDEGRYTVTGLAAGKDSIVVRRDQTYLEFPAQPPRPKVTLKANKTTEVLLDATTQEPPVVSIDGKQIAWAPPPPRRDRVAPTVTSARLTLVQGKRYVTVDAVDDGVSSGLNTIQIRVGGTPLPTTAYTTGALSAPGSAQVTVRVSDKAGNSSAWKVAK